MDSHEDQSVNGWSSNRHTIEVAHGAISLAPSTSRVGQKNKCENDFKHGFEPNRRNLFFL